MHHSSCQSGNKSSEGLKPKSFRPKRRHSFFALLLAAVLFVGLLPTVSLPITAASPAADFEFDESIGMITKYTGSATNVVIPETINGVTVTAIGMEAFAGCSWLTSVSIPNSVVTIGGATFSGCSSLTSVAIPDSVTAIGVAAFAGCSSLTSVTIPEHVTEIRYAAFSRCSSLVEIRVAENNPAYCSVDGVLFSKDQKMICSYPAGRSQKNYAIPAGVSDICYEAFAGCSALTSITIPEGVTGIEYQAFAGCLSLTSVTIPESVTAIGGGVFYSCSSLSEIRVAENNPAYCSVDGVLFSKDQKTIYTYPAGRSEKKLCDSELCAIHSRLGFSGLFLADRCDNSEWCSRDRQWGFFRLFFVSRDSGRGKQSGILFCRRRSVFEGSDNNLQLSGRPYLKKLYDSRQCAIYRRFCFSGVFFADQFDDSGSCEKYRL